MMRSFSKSSALRSQGGYAGSSEFANVRGVSAVAVSLRAATLLHMAKRDFIWYLQGLSLKDGGFKAVARALLDIFPDRLGTPAMHQSKVANGKKVSPRLSKLVECDLDSNTWPFESSEPEPEQTWEQLIQNCRHAALTNRDTSHSSAFYSSIHSCAELSIEQFLVELCTNPKLQFSLPGMDETDFEFEAKIACENSQGFELKPGEFRRAELNYFHDIIGALVEYRARQQRKIRDNFHLTAIGGKIWETLDYALASQNMVLLDGLEGRGKTEAVKAWCELHPGQARCVSLKGIATKTDVFGAIAEALGITCSYNITGTEKRAKIEDVLKRSKIMLVIDEAHFCFNQTRRMTARPELIDWIDTAICNRGIPVALVTTPQFIECMARAKNQVEWNFNQFRRRVKRWVKLPDKNTEAHIMAVAQKVFQNASPAVIKKVAGYALLSFRDLSAVGDVAAEVRAMLGTDDLSKTTVEMVNRAITDYLMPSDLAFKVSLAAAEAKQPKTRRAAPQPLPELEAETDLEETAQAETNAPAKNISGAARGTGLPAISAAQIGGRRASSEAVLTAP